MVVMLGMRLMMTAAAAAVLIADWSAFLVFDVFDVEGLPCGMPARHCLTSMLDLVGLMASLALLLPNRVC